MNRPCMLRDDEDFEVLDEWEKAAENCCGGFGPDGVFRCGAVGSEDCDWECPFSGDIGYTLEEIEKREESERNEILETPNPEIESQPTPEELESAGQKRLIP